MDWRGFASSLSDHLRCPIFSRIRSFRRTSSHPFFRLRRMMSWAAPNGGEGGIRTPGTLSGTTDFESVTFGHSATSPKSWVRKSSRSALASTDYRSCHRYAPQDGHCFLSCPKGIRSRNPYGTESLRRSPSTRYHSASVTSPKN